MTTLWTKRDPGLIHVFRIPDELPDGFCFGGGRPVNFQMVDWFNTPPPELIDAEITLETITANIKRKDYYKAGGNFLVIINDGTSFVVEGE